MSHQGPPRPLRPIAPRTTPGSPAPAPPPEEKVTRASTACSECKRRRTKCSVKSTGPPCTECAKYSRECFVDESADKRRKLSVRATEEELKYYRDFLNQLLLAIRQGDRVDVDSLVTGIRAAVSEQEIHSLVAQFFDYLAPDDNGNERPVEVDGVDGVDGTPTGREKSKKLMPDGSTR